jgi:ParB/Sulfiredoxin domain
MSINIEAVEFERLLPPLEPDERESLRESIAQHGVIDPVIYWEETGELVDGFHRSAIAAELGIGYPRLEMAFPDKRDAVLFVIGKHLGRRSLQLSTLEYLREVRKSLAKDLVGEGMTQREVAGKLGVGLGTVNRYVNPTFQAEHSAPSAEPEPEPLVGEAFTERAWCPYCMATVYSWHIDHGVYQCDRCRNVMGPEVRQQPGLIAPSVISKAGGPFAPAQMRVGDLDALPDYPQEPREVVAWRALLTSMRFAMRFEPSALVDAPRDPVMRGEDERTVADFEGFLAELARLLRERAEKPQLRRVQ